MAKTVPIWSEDNKAGISIVKTDQKWLRGKHKGEYMWKVVKGDEYLIVDQQEAIKVEEWLEQNPLEREDKTPKEENKPEEVTTCTDNSCGTCKCN